jgi:hypothetical protein
MLSAKTAEFQPDAPVYVIKLYLALMAPLAYCVLAPFLVDSAHSTGYLIVGAVVVWALASLVFVRTLHAMAKEKQRIARQKYPNKTFQELKVIFLANPREAIMFISVATRPDDRPK